MTAVPAAIAAEAAILRQNVALSVVRQSAEADQAIANIIQQSAENIAVNASRGNTVNIRA